MNNPALDMLKSFSPWSLFGGFLFGIAGFYIFNQGRKIPNLPWVVIGLVLMVYPLFVTDPLPTWGIGFALCAVAYQTKM